jgi:hypothetical protein
MKRTIPSLADVGQTGVCGKAGLAASPTVRRVSDTALFGLAELSDRYLSIQGRKLTQGAAGGAAARRGMTAILAWATIGLASGWAQAQPLTIENAALAVKFDAGRFSLTTKPTQRVFVKDGQLSAPGGTAKVVPVTDKTFGPGQSIEVAYAEGHRDTITLFPDLPFALFRSSIHNRGSEATVTKSVRPFSAVVDLGRPAAELTTLGTGGLLAPDKNPGSYVWLAVAEPQSRRGVVCGWLTHDRGSGVMFSKVENEQVRVAGQIDYGRLRAAPGKTVELETLAVGGFDDARLGLEAWADAVAKVYDIKLRPQPTGYCTWYSQPHGGASDQTYLAELSAFAATNLAPFGFSVVQIDDRWQAGISSNGPKRNFTTHAPNGPYPDGMKAISDKIKSDALVPGIWFMPFAGTWYDPWFKDHQDWFVKHADGRPFETPWGGTCLDMTHPGAREYLRDEVRRLAHEWGFQYFKMDGLSTGVGVRPQYVNTGYRDDGLGESVLSNPDKSNVEAYRDGLKLVREAAGNDIFFLGCCAPQNMRSYGGAMGLVDAMRIGPDNGADWGGLQAGPTFGSRHYFLHGRVWYNDPDPVYVRPSVPLSQAQLICSWVALSGQLNLSSEWLPAMPPERLDILKRTMTGHGLRPRPVDLFESQLPRLWLLTDARQAPRRDVVGLFNWSDQEETFDCPLKRIGLAGDTEYVAFDFWQNALLAPVKERLHLTVPARSCRILAVRQRLDHPQLLSTSRHVTQGIVDVLEEQWTPQPRTLSGRSKIVVGDPCEMRIVLPVGSGAVDVLGASVSPVDAAAGVKITSQHGPGLARVTITSPVSRAVAWTVNFSASKVK